MTCMYVHNLIPLFFQETVDINKMGSLLGLYATNKICQWLMFDEICASKRNEY